MMKKQTAIFFILLANIILLAHVVVPHHHHEKMVCVNSSHCQSDSYEHGHETPTHDHQHDGESDSQVCVLKQVVFIASNQWNQYDNCLLGSDKPLLLPDFQAVLSDNGFKATMPRIVSSAQSDLNVICNFNFISSALGLRAPPVV